MMEIAHAERIGVRFRRSDGLENFTTNPRLFTERGGVQRNQFSLDHQEVTRETVGAVEIATILDLDFDAGPVNYSMSSHRTGYHVHNPAAVESIFPESPLAPACNRRISSANGFL